METDLNFTKLTISLPTNLIEKMDVRAAKTFKRKSEYIKDLIIEDLAKDSE